MGKAEWKKWDFKWRRNVERVLQERMWEGRLFQIVGAAERKTRAPNEMLQRELEWESYSKRRNKHKQTKMKSLQAPTVTYFITEASLRKAILSWIEAFSLVVWNTVHIINIQQSNGNEHKPTYIFISINNSQWRETFLLLFQQKSNFLVNFMQMQWQFLILY